MQPDQVNIFLSQYPDTVFKNALSLHKLLLKTLPGITEQLDLPGKIIRYSSGQKYSDTMGKSCIYFKKLADLNLDTLEKLSKATIKYHK